MELRSTDAIDQINAHYGGVMSLCSRLRTDPVEGKGRTGGGNRSKGAGVQSVVSPAPGEGRREGPHC